MKSIFSVIFIFLLHKADCSVLILLNKNQFIHTVNQVYDIIKKEQIDE